MTRYAMWKLHPVLFSDCCGSTVDGIFFQNESTEAIIINQFVVRKLSCHWRCIYILFAFQVQ